MGFISALKTLGKSGLDPVVPQTIKQQIQRVENLGGKLHEGNIPEMVATQNLTPSQLELLQKYVKENGSPADIELSDFSYTSWKKRFDEDPESRLAKRKQEVAGEDLLQSALRIVRKANQEENLAFVKDFNKKLPAEKYKEQLNFTKFYESRPAFPKGVENVTAGRTTVDLDDIANKFPVEDIDFTKLKKVEPKPLSKGNVVNIDFTKLKKRGESSNRNKVVTLPKGKEGASDFQKIKSIDPKAKTKRNPDGTVEVSYRDEYKPKEVENGLLEFEPEGLEVSETTFKNTSNYKGEKHEPIAVTKKGSDYIIIDGHHRTKLAKEEGRKVKAVMIPFEEVKDMQKKGLNQSDMKKEWLRSKN